MLSRTVADLSQIQILDLAFNGILRIETSIGQLTNLAGLRLHANKLQSFDDIAPLLSLSKLGRWVFLDWVLHTDTFTAAYLPFPTTPISTSTCRSLSHPLIIIHILIFILILITLLIPILITLHIPIRVP